MKDTEDCPCGSGLAFKDCCKTKKPSVKKSKKPADVQIMERMRVSMKSCCMHPDKARCNGKIKSAHALQNNKIISQLAGQSRHVYVLDTKRKPILVPLDTGEIIPVVDVHKVSANDATTLNCFCDYHDNVAFASIEKGAPDFDDSEKMKFTYAYKAFVFEYYKQWLSVDIFRRCFKDNPPAFFEKKMVAMYRMHQLKMAEFEPVKQFFDKKILAGKVDGVYNCSVKIPESIKFADYVYIAPDYDLNGKKIKHTQHGKMHRIALTIFPEKSWSWLLVSCLESEKSIYDSLFKQLQEASLEKLKYYLNLILPLYSENMVLSPSLWEPWNEESKLAYISYANLQGADAVKMGMCIGMGLKNAARDKNNDVYKNMGKLNIFISHSQY